MKWLLFIYLFLEVIVTINLGGMIGGWNTFLEILATAIVGGFIIANFKKVMMQSMMAIMAKKLKAENMVTDNLLTLIGAVLLIVPGFVSDIIGLILQLPFVKNLIASRIQVPQGHTQQTYKHKGDDNVIDVEIVEHDAISK